MKPDPCALVPEPRTKKSWRPEGRQRLSDRKPEPCYGFFLAAVFFFPAVFFLAAFFLPAFRVLAAFRAGRFFAPAAFFVAFRAFFFFVAFFFFADFFFLVATSCLRALRVPRDSANAIASI